MRDRRWVRCLDNKLSQTNAVLRIIELRMPEFEEAITDRDVRRTRYLLSVFRVQKERLISLFRSARACPGNRRVREGRVQIQVVQPGSQ